MTEIFTAENLLALLTLSLLEIVLGIDNIVFLSILTGKLAPHERPRARRLGLFLAMFMRIGLLLALSWVMRLTDPLFGIAGHPISGRDLILLGGGLFLIAKATWEIHDKLEGSAHGDGPARKAATFGAVLFQILLLDLVFSLDSVITAVGMARAPWVMITAVVIAVGAMLVFAGSVSEFVERHPTVKMLALAFLILIGVMLVAEGFGQHVNKGYIYFAMAFSLGVEILNMRLRKVASKPVELRNTAIEPIERSDSA
jgi:predicted tellurium resistance membrane protein TerC